jgi:ABC-type oligopeptide transport system substrate-binding subunit
MLRYAHALDRVLQWNYYWIPNYYPPGTSTVVEPLRHARRASQQ